mmetsp:Transcript_44700/g.71417  ORF Transcript_44700/g.71417 Transcript_44700/m.71417 type:complete len:452 (+) Transcript_44700:77-1432(+)
MSLGYAKRLVRTVARAFYDDDAILVLDALCRNPYLIDHEQAGRGPLEEKFGLQSKQVRRTLQSLYDDSLIEKYVRNYKDPGAVKGTRKKKRTFWYINYLHFVKLVMLRLHFMIKVISDKEEEQVTTDKLYFCPNCKEEYDLLTAISSQDMETAQFFCQKCERDLDEKIFLKENKAQVKTKKSASGAKTLSLKEKRSTQILEDVGLRDGIEDLLKKIKEFPIPPSTNLPSDHIETEIQVHKEKVEKEKHGGGGGGGGHGGGGHGEAGSFVNQSGQNVQVKILSESGMAAQAEEKKATTVDYSAAELPAWMQRDVTGAISSSAIQDAQERQAKRQRTGVTSATAAASLARGGASALLNARTEKADENVSTSEKEPVPTLGRSDSELRLDEEKRELESSTMVMVAGVKKRLGDVTKEDEDNMTAEEYEQYSSLAKTLHHDDNDSNEDEDEDDFF